MKNKWRLIKKISPWLIAILLILLRFKLTQTDYKNGDSIRIAASVSSEPSRYATIQIVKMKDLRVTFPDYPWIDYGDHLIVEGMVEGDKLIHPKLIEIKKSNHFLIKLRQHITRFYQKYLPEPHASLMAGIVLGSKEGITNDFRDLLRKSGTAHVVVASGMNATLTAGFLLALLLTFLNRRKAVIFSMIGVWVYTFMSGFEAPIVRATLMASVALMASLTGRLYAIKRALIISIIIMLFYNPRWLFDLGFQLSFVATLSLMIFESKVSRLIRFVPGIFKEGLATSLAAQIGVAPIIFWSFGQFNPFSPLINALVLWVVAPVMIIGATSGLLSLLLPGLASYILYLAYPLTYFFVWVVTNMS